MRGRWSRGTWSAEAIARSIKDPVMRAHMLRRVVAAVTTADPDRAEAIARSIEHTVMRAGALADIVRLSAQPDPKGHA